MSNNVMAGPATMMSVNPTGHFAGVDTFDLLEACGLIPAWLSQYGRDLADDLEVAPIKEFLTQCYGFGDLMEMTGSTITESGVMQYPGDPDLHPLILVTYKDSGVEVMQYQYGIVAMRDSKEDGWFLTRMD